MSRIFVLRERLSASNLALTPRRSNVIVAEALAYLARIGSPQSLDSLSVSMRKHMETELSKQNQNWERNRLQVLAALKPEKLQKLSKEWQHYVKIRKARWKPQQVITPECQRTMDTVLGDTFGTSEAESAYILFDEEC